MKSGQVIKKNYSMSQDSWCVHALSLPWYNIACAWEGGLKWLTKKLQHMHHLPQIDSIQLQINQASKTEATKQPSSHVIDDQESDVFENRMSSGWQTKMYIVHWQKW